MATNKNTMLPTFQGTYAQMIKGLKSGAIDSPAWMYIEDRDAIAFIHYETNDNGIKTLTPHIILWDKIVNIEEKLSDLIDPETGEEVNVKDYVDTSKKESKAYTDTITSEIRQSITMLTEVNE